MLAFKTEIHPTPEQAQKVRQSIGNCRWLYNRYIAYNKEQYAQTGKFVSAIEFDKYVNHELSQEFPWIKLCGSKARKKAIKNAENAFLRFFKGLAEFPKFKRKNQQLVKIYFVKDSPTDIIVERHRIKVPTLGWVRLKEKGYIPTRGQVVNCTIEQKADRYYISVLFKEDPKRKIEHLTHSEGIGVDVGLKEFAVASDEQRFKNINKSSKIKRTEKQLKRAQRSLSRKYESKKKRGEQSATKGSNIRKQILKVQKLHQRLANMRSAYRAYVVSMLVKAKPAYITIECLNIKGMMKNRHLSKAIANQGFYDFKQKLLQACAKRGIQLRQVSTFYPSSKQCSYCDYSKKKLSLSERVFRCESCGYVMDRESNAATNLKQATEYVILT